MPDFKMIDVDSKLIENTFTSISEDIKELLSISAILSGETMSNLNPYWQGPAKESFEMQFNVYVESFKKLVDTYETLNNQLKTAGNNYDRADDSVKQLIAKMMK